MSGTINSGNPNPESHLPKKGPGRPKCIPNRFTGTIRDAIQAATDSYEDPETHEKGAVAWLKHLRDVDHKAFASLLGRIIPQVTQISGDPSLPAIRISFEKPDDSPKD